MTRRQYADLAERAGWTFVQAAVAVALVTDAGLRATLVAAGTAGLIAVGKALVAFRLGGPTAATLPADLT